MNISSVLTPKDFKDTDFGTAAHATRASSVNKLTSTSKMYELLSNTRCLCEDALNYFQLMDGKTTPFSKK